MEQDKRKFELSIYCEKKQIKNNKENTFRLFLALISYNIMLYLLQLLYTFLKNMSLNR